jgi:hypothetical protein
LAGERPAAAQKGCIVDKYVVTVAEDRASGRDQALTTIRVDLSDGIARVTEFSVRAADGISVDEETGLPVVDLILRALTKKEPARASMVSKSASAVAAKEPRVGVVSRGVAASRPAKRASVTKQAGNRDLQPPAVAQGRPYRRMPEPDEVLAAYAQTGTITGLAGYFDVPQYTAKDWARRLRRMGYQLGS